MNLKINKIFHLRFLEPFISVVFWGLLIASPLLFGEYEEGTDWEHILKVWRSFLPFMALFLLNRFVFLPFFFFRGLRWLYFISNMLMILGVAIGVHLYRTNVHQPQLQENRREVMAPRRQVPSGDRPPPARERPPMLGENMHPPRGEEGMPPTQLPPRQLPPFISFMVVSILIIGFDTGLMISVQWAQSEQKRTRAEKENVETQLAFLQSQVSPHFFMNTLNNIHSLIDINTTEAKESIIKLSKLMRHLLYDSQVEKIPLKKEIEFIQHYVELMRLRFSEKVQIDLHLPETIPDKSIPPLLFTSFLENAFKHGISYQESSYIFITFSYGPGEKLSFIIRNSNPDIRKEGGPSGIGIENSRKRLDLIYGNAYSLKIDDTKEEFIVSLNIPV